MVACVHDGYAIRFQPVAQRKNRVVQILRRDADVAHIEDALHDFVVADAGAEFLERDRKIGVLHLPRESLAQ